APPWPARGRRLQRSRPAAGRAAAGGGRPPRLRARARQGFRAPRRRAAPRIPRTRRPAHRAPLRRALGRRPAADRDRPHRRGPRFRGHPPPALGLPGQRRKPLIAVYLPGSRILGYGSRGDFLAEPTKEGLMEGIRRCGLTVFLAARIAATGGGCGGRKGPHARTNHIYFMGTVIDGVLTTTIGASGATTSHISLVY